LGARIRRLLGEHLLISDPSMRTLPILNGPGRLALKLFAQALARDSEHDIAEKERLLEQAAVMEPHFALAHAYLARLYADLGRPKDASEQIFLAKMDEDDLPIREQYRLLGAFYKMQGQFDKAEQQYRSIVSRFPNDWRAHLELSESALRNGDHERAVKECQTAIAIDDSRPDAFIRLCMAQLFSNNLEGARSALARASSLGLNTPDLYRVTGYVDLFRNEVPAAIRAFQQLIDYPFASVKSAGVFLSAQAEIYGGRFREALATLEAGIDEDTKQNDDDAEAEKRMAKAQVHCLLGETAQAIVECKLVPQSNLDPAQLLNLGSILARLSRINEAQTILGKMKSATYAPAAASDIETLQGEILLAAGQNDLALKSLIQARNRQPGDTPLEPLARALMQAGQLELAAKEYEAVCDRKGLMMFPPNHAWFMGTWVQSLYEAGRCLHSLNRKSEAQQYFRQYLWILDGVDSKMPSVEQSRNMLRER
jgi:tetratricopeptide (TPR) repeat protein